MAAYMRKYATGTGADIIIPIVKTGVQDFAVSADWTPAAGDVKVSKDGAASANIATLPVAITDIGWKFVFSDAELTCARLSVNVVDSATKAIEDQHIAIETYGNASAQHAFDLDAATADANVTQVNGASTVTTITAYPGDEPSFIGWLGAMWAKAFYGGQQTSTTQTIYEDDGTTVLVESTITNAAGTFTRTKFADP